MEETQQSRWTIHLIGAIRSNAALFRMHLSVDRDRFKRTGICPKRFLRLPTGRDATSRASL